MKFEGITQPDNTEALRVILETQQRRPVTYGEALEVGEALIGYFKLLASLSESESSEPQEV